jgi:hypothetical protein
MLYGYGAGCKWTAGRAFTCLPPPGGEATLQKEPCGAYPRKCLFIHLSKYPRRGLVARGAALQSRLHHAPLPLRDRRCPDNSKGQSPSCLGENIVPDIHACLSQVESHRGTFSSALRGEGGLLPGISLAIATVQYQRAPPGAASRLGSR